MCKKRNYNWSMKGLNTKSSEMKQNYASIHKNSNFNSKLRLPSWTLKNKRMPGPRNFVESFSWSFTKTSTKGRKYLDKSIRQIQWSLNLVVKLTPFHLTRLRGSRQIYQSSGSASVKSKREAYP